jgi:hypothetical protein
MKAFGMKKKNQVFCNWQEHESPELDVDSNFHPITS